MRSDPFCSAGSDFYIIETDGSYYRCYSERLHDVRPIGNIVFDDDFKAIEPRKSRCPYAMQCAAGDRVSCDYGATVRYDEDSSPPSCGPSYPFVPATSLDGMADQRHAQVFWHLSRLCNFACVYCNEPYSASNDTVEAHDADPSRLVEVIDKMARRFNKIKINLTGGECTRHPAFLDICTAINLRQDIFELCILSNMSNRRKLDAVFSMDWNPGRISFWASCHFSDPRFDLYDFTDSCIAASRCGKVDVSTVDHQHESRFYPLYRAAMKKLGLRARHWHMYYESSRARTSKFVKDFEPKSLGEVLMILGVSSKDEIQDMINEERKEIQKVGIT